MNPKLGLALSSRGIPGEPEGFTYENLIYLLIYAHEHPEDRIAKATAKAFAHVLETYHQIHTQKNYGQIKRQQSKRKAKPASFTPSQSN